jgi:hypothetical protein
MIKQRQFRGNSYLIAFLSREVLIWVSLGFSILVSLLIMGTGTLSSIQISVALILYTLPFYLLLSVWSSKDTNLVARLVYSLMLSTMLLSFLFAFFGIAKSPFAFWMFAVALNALGIIVFIKCGDRNSADEFRILQLVRLISFTGILVAVASLLLRMTSPIVERPQAWIPDDFPLFAEWGRLISDPTLSNSVVAGLSFKYHWFTYSLLGGFDRLFSEDFLVGPTQIAPVITWLFLALGAAAIVGHFERQLIPAMLAASAVLFSMTIGTLANSTGGFGGITVSPSHLLSSFWLMAAVLFGYQRLKLGSKNWLGAFLFAFIGFSLMLSKVTAFVAVISILFLASYFVSVQQVEGRRRFLSGSFSALRLTMPLLLGGLVAYILFLDGSDTGFAIEPNLLIAPESDLTQYVIQVLPLGAYLFAQLVLVVPAICLYSSSERRNPFVLSILIVGSLALVLALVVQLPSSNEAWLFAGILGLILPLSSLFVWRWITALSSSRRQSLTVWLWLGLNACLISLFLIVTREADFFLLRPWATPIAVTSLSVLSALSLLLIMKSMNIVSFKILFRYVAGTVVSTLFLTSITFGLGLKITAASDSLDARDFVSQQRDLWLLGAQETAGSDSLLPESETLAIYSTAPTEETLVRWIPYFTKRQIYNFRSEDFIQNIFIGETTMEMQQREWAVREYVETGSRTSCEKLSQDGVTQIWLTPNFTLSSGLNSPTPIHSLMTIECELETGS